MHGRRTSKLATGEGGSWAKNEYITNTHTSQIVTCVHCIYYSTYFVSLLGLHKTPIASGTPQLNLYSLVPAYSIIIF